MQLHQETSAVSDYKRAFNGRFSGILRWPQFQTLWEALTASPDGWYVYEPEESAPPATPLTAAELGAFLVEAEAYLREHCTADCCGAVYADSLQTPTFVKIYNPRLMGGCGMGKAPLPQWLLSRMPPVSLIDDQPHHEGLMGRLFHHHS
jgi:hypothetical protein